MDIVRTCMDRHASKHVSINIPTPNQAAPQPNDGSRATRLDCDAAAPPSCHGKNPCPPQDAQARTQPPPALFPRPYPAHPSTMQTRHGHERFVSDRCRMYSCRCTVEPMGGFSFTAGTQKRTCTYSRHAERACGRSKTLARRMRCIDMYGVFFYFSSIFLESYGVRVCGITSPCPCCKAGGK